MIHPMSTARFTRYQPHYSPDINHTIHRGPNHVDSLLASRLTTSHLLHLPACYLLPLYYIQLCLATCYLHTISNSAILQYEKDNHCLGPSRTCPRNVHASATRRPLVRQFIIFFCIYSTIYHCFCGPPPHGVVWARDKMVKSNAQDQGKAYSATWIGCPSSTC